MENEMNYYGKIKGQLNYLIITLIFLFAFSILTISKLFRTNAYLLNRLNEKSYIFAPSDGKVQLIRLNQITEVDIKNKIKEVIQSDSNISKDIYEANLNFMLSYLDKSIAPKYIEMFKERVGYLQLNNITESLKTLNIIKFTQINNLKYEIISNVESNILIDNRITGTRSDTISLSIEILPPKENSPWNYTIKRFNRYDRQTFEKLFQGSDQ